MPLLTTDALILHSANYLESSRLLRMLTREAGVQSAVARGARSSRRRFGSAADLFAEGQAQLQMKPGRDLHALNSFDVTRSRTALASDLGRFTAANALSEVVLRLVHDEPVPRLYDAVAGALDQLAIIDRSLILSAALGAIWYVVAEAGFSPAIDRCAQCEIPIPDDGSVRFQAVAGGLLCRSCDRLGTGGRSLPASARRAIQDWLAGGVPTVDPPEARAHQRLLREFLEQFLPDNRPLRAYEVWEAGEWESSRA